MSTVEERLAALEALVLDPMKGNEELFSDLSQLAGHFPWVNNIAVNTGTAGDDWTAYDQVIARPFSYGSSYHFPDREYGFVVTPQNLQNPRHVQASIGNINRNNHTATLYVSRSAGNLDNVVIIGVMMACYQSSFSADEIIQGQTGTPATGEPL